MANIFFNHKKVSIHQRKNATYSLYLYLLFDIDRSILFERSAVIKGMVCSEGDIDMLMLRMYVTKCNVLESLFSLYTLSLTK